MACKTDCSIMMVQRGVVVSVSLIVVAVVVAGGGGLGLDGMIDCDRDSMMLDAMVW